MAPENRPWKRRFLLETISFRGYVSFREANTNEMQEKYRKVPSCESGWRNATPKFGGLGYRAMLRLNQY